MTDYTEKVDFGDDDKVKILAHPSKWKKQRVEKWLKYLTAKYASNSKLVDCISRLKGMNGKQLVRYVKCKSPQMQGALNFTFFFSRPRRHKIDHWHTTNNLIRFSKDKMINLCDSEQIGMKLYRELRHAMDAVADQKMKLIKDNKYA